KGCGRSASSGSDRDEEDAEEERHMICPNCHECPFEKGVCERLANRGRRFFLLGALALPVAVKITRVAPIVAPKAKVSTMTIKLNGGEWMWSYADDGYQRDGHIIQVESSFAVAT